MNAQEFSVSAVGLSDIPGRSVPAGSRKCELVIFTLALRSKVAVIG